MPRQDQSSNTTLTPKRLRELLGKFDVGFFITKYQKDHFFNHRIIGFRASLYTLDIALNPVILWEFMQDLESGKTYKRGIMVHA